MGEILARDPRLGLGQHLGRHVDTGNVRIRAEMRQRQTGADADFEDALPWPVVGDAHRFLAAGMKHRAEDDVVRPRNQPIGTDRIAKVHWIPLVAVDFKAAAVAARGCPPLAEL